MKKRIGKVITLVLCLSLTMTMFTACGSKKEDNEEANGEGKKQYVIATDTAFAPFEFTNDKNEFVGIDVEILAAIAEDQGFTYKLDALGFDAALAAVQTGAADGVIAGMSITDKRKETFDFSAAYYDADVTMAVAEDSSISSLEELKDKKVAIKTGTNGADYAKSKAEEYGFTVVEFKDSPTMYQDVILGNTVACFEDFPVMAYSIKQGAKMKIPEGLTAAGSSYGFAVAKGKNAELLKMFDKGLENIKKNGKFQEIVDKYTK